MPGSTEIAVLLDRSGSMARAREDHEGGLNSFIRDQRELEGDVRFTFVQFDDQDPCEVIHNGTPLKDVAPVTLKPRGYTPLLDAVGKSIGVLDKRLQQAAAKPDQVIFMIITDGLENASQEWKKDMVKKLVEEKQAAGWAFLFLGANIDAFHEAGSIGIAQVTTMSYTDRDAGAMYAAVSSNVGGARQLSMRGAPAAAVRDSLNWTDAQRSAAVGQDPQTTAAPPAPEDPPVTLKGDWKVTRR